MPSIRDALLKNIEVRLVIKIDDLGKYQKDSKDILSACVKAVSSKWDIFADTEKNMIYVGRKK